jgi:hypothetical protein
MIRSVSLAALAAAAFSATAAQAVSFTTSYSENFNTLARTGTTGTALPAGWSFTESDDNANSSYGVSDGSGGTNFAGNTYSFGVTGAEDRAFGTVQSGTLLSTIFAQFENGNSRTVTDLTVSYYGEFWRLGTTGRADRLDVAYSINGGAFVQLDALDFVTPVTTGAAGGRNGNLADNRTLRTATLAGIDLGAGETIRFRWSDFNASGSDDGLAIDDFSLAATLEPVVVTPPPAVPEPATWAMMIGGFGLVGGALRRRRGVATVAA